jgi:hypothetical protein
MKDKLIRMRKKVVVLHCKLCSYTSLEETIENNDNLILTVTVT